MPTGGPSGKYACLDGPPRYRDAESVKHWRRIARSASATTYADPGRADGDFSSKLAISWLRDKGMVGLTSIAGIKSV